MYIEKDKKENDKNYRCRNLIYHSIVFAGHHALAARDVDGEFIGPLSIFYSDHGLLLAEESFRAEREQNRSLEMLRMIQDVQVIVGCLKRLI